MTYYVSPHQPEYLFLRTSKNERDARYKAIQELACLVNNHSLRLTMPNGFNSRNLIEIKEENLMPNNREEIINAVEILAKLSESKQKSQSLHQQSLGARKSIDLLFDEKPLGEDDFTEIKKSLKLIKDYAVALSAYKEALPEAEKAKKYLEETLKLPE